MLLQCIKSPQFEETYTHKMQQCTNLNHISHSLKQNTQIWNSISMYMFFHGNKNTDLMKFHTNLGSKKNKNTNQGRVWQYWYLNTMLETVKLPAGISDLDTGLTNVDWDALSHFLRENGRKSLRIGEKTKKKEEKAFIKTPSDSTLCDVWSLPDATNL